MSLLSKVPSGSIDAVICDLPYGTTQNPWDSTLCLPLLWYHYLRVTKVNSPIVLFAQTPFDKILGASKVKLLKYEWIWVKNRATGHLNAKRVPLKAHENILVFCRGQHTYNPQGLERKAVPTIRKATDNGSNYGISNKAAIQTHKGYPSSVLEFAVDQNTLHPTQKPIDLCEYLVKTYTNEGDTILDNCMGSGTTGLAAKRNYRGFIGMEQDQGYFDIARLRIG